MIDTTTFATMVLSKNPVFSRCVVQEIAMEQGNTKSAAGSSPRTQLLEVSTPQQFLDVIAGKSWQLHGIRLGCQPHSRLPYDQPMLLSYIC